MRSHAKAPSAASIGSAFVAAFVLSLLLLALPASSAFAEMGHSVLRTFSTGPNTDPRGIATDSAGNVYVVEAGARRVDKFDSTGARGSFGSKLDYVNEGSITGTPEGPLPIESWNSGAGIAVDRSGGPNDGTIYLGFIDPSPGGEVVRFDSSGAFGAKDQQSFDYTCGVALNQATGALYRINDYGRVARYPTPSTRLSTDASLLTEGNCAIAVDSAGDVYAAYPANEFTGVQKFDASQFGVTPAVASAELAAPARALAVNPANDDLLADSGSQIAIFNAAGVQQGAAFGSLSASRGITTDPAGNVLATDAGGGVFVYGPGQVALPTATTGGANNVTAKSAEVEGSVDPDGAGDVVACEVRYGEDSGYADGSAPCAPGAPITSATPVTATLTGLVSGTTYHYRVFATNANGTTMASSEQTFSTPNAIEGVTTEGAENVQKDSATLNGSYVGDGQEAHYFFEWGATGAYGHTTPVPPGAVAGSGSGFQAVAPVQISGLQGGATYHYRLVVSDPDGISRGQDATFTTPAAVTDLTAERPQVATETSAQLRGSFEGDGTYETHYYFEWGPTANYGHVTPAPPGASVPAGSGRIALPPVEITGLEGGVTYHYRVVASNAAGATASPDVSFKTAEAPIIGKLTTRNVTATSAELAGEVNPRYGTTSYRFEWGNTTAYGNSVPVPAGDLGSGSEMVPVTAQLTGLTPGVTYHFRLVATSQYGTTRSPDQGFGFYPPNCPNSQVRQETGSNGLPDCRAYELVTPSFMQGTTIYPVLGPTTGGATSPAKIAYGGSYGTFPDPAGTGTSNVTADLYVSTRSDTGWLQHYVGLPATQSLSMGTPPYNFEGILGSQSIETVFRGVQASPTLDRVLSYARGWPTYVKESKEPPVNSYETGQIYGEPSNAPFVFDTGTGAVAERWPSNLNKVPGGSGFIGQPQASADFSHFVFSSNLVFSDDHRGIPGGEEFVTCCDPRPPVPKRSIYDNDVKSGTVVLASLKSDNVTQFEGYVLNVSSDGSHILMAEEGGAMPLIEHPSAITGPLYLRADGEHTYEIAPGRKVRYVGSTEDGRTVYLTSSEQLTSDDHDSSVDLFVWRESAPTELTLVSKGSGGSGNTDSCSASWTTNCDVGIISFFPYANLPAGQGGNGFSDNFIASRSGDIYFESPEQLLGAKGEAGGVNLYLYRQGTLRYVTTMKAGDKCGPLGCTDGPVARMQVTPDGAHMALVTSSNLTEYDSYGFKEMYSYDPQTGQIACVSCRPDGKPPVAEGPGLSYGDTLASQNGLFLTNDGRVFFSTLDALVERDTNEVRDVYEYSEGKPQLISAGLGQEIVPNGGVEGYANKPGLVGVSANGTDVYFATIDRLVTQDHNGQQLKIYDARTGGGFPSDLAPPNCAAADECHGPGSSPPDLPSDRTSASLGNGARKKARSKPHKARKHKKKHKAHTKKRAGKRHGTKQGRKNRG